MRLRYRPVLAYILREWRMLAAIIVLTFFTSALAALQPWPMKILVDYALGHAALPEGLRRLWRGSDPSSQTLLYLAGIAGVATFAAISGLDMALTWVWTIVGQRLVFRLTTDLFHRLQRLSLAFHRRMTTADCLERLSTDTWCVYSLTDGLLAPFSNVTKLIAVGALAWKLDPKLASLSLLLAPLLAISSVIAGNRLKHNARLSREALSTLSSFVHQTLIAIPVVQAFSTAETNRDRFADLAENAVKHLKRGALANSAFGLVNGFIIAVGSALVIYVGGQRVISGTISLGSLIVFLTYVRNLQSASEGLLLTYGSLKPLEASMDRVLEILEARDEVENLPGAMVLPRPNPRGASIRFEDVTFGYEPGRPVLSGISLEAHPGEKIALVGPTGAGKSTLVSLIPRFSDPWHGRVTLDGTDVRKIEIKSLRQQIAIVLQETFLFPESVANNIAYGRPGASRQEVIAAAVAADAHTFITRLPEGYDSILGERGATLSGGERQRLAIARALLKDAPILILDEPTSSLDSVTESSVMKAVHRLMEGRTTFVIAHRLSTIRDASRVLVLEDGRVVESGSPEGLLDQDSILQRMYSPRLAGLAGRAPR